MRKLKLMLSCFFVILTGCSTIEQIPTDYKGADSGQVVVSIGANDKMYSVYTLLFKKRGENQPQTLYAQGRFDYRQFHMFPFNSKGDYRNLYGEGDVLVYKLPPGDYEIYKHQVYMVGAYSETRYTSDIPVSIPFSVKAGETVYLGNYTAYTLRAKNKLGFAGAYGAVFVVEDQLADDLKVLQAKGEKLSSDRLINQTPKPEELTTPVFVPRATFRVR